LEQSIETTADAVVVEGRQLGVVEAEDLGDVPRRPFTNAVERFAGEEDVLEQEGDAKGGIDATASISAREVGAEEFLEAHALEQQLCTWSRYSM